MASRICGTLGGTCHHEFQNERFIHCTNCNFVTRSGLWCPESVNFQCSLRSCDVRVRLPYVLRLRGGHRSWCEDTRRVSNHKERARYERRRSPRIQPTSTSMDSHTNKHPSERLSFSAYHETSKRESFSLASQLRYLSSIIFIGCFHASSNFTDKNQSQVKKIST